MNGRRMDPRQHSRVMMQQQALMRSQLAQAATMPPEPLNSYVLSWHGHGGGPQHGGRGGGGGPGPIPSLSSGQGFYTVESLQGATAMPIPHNGPGLLGMGGPMLQPGFDSHHQLPVIMHPMLGHKVLANGMGFPQGGAAGGGMVRMPGPEPPHMFGNAPPPHHLFVQNRLPQGYPHARRDVGPMFFSRERERDRVRVRDRDRDRDRERSRDRGRVRDRERERDRERDRERVRDRDRDRERERGRERDRDRDQDRESRQVEQKFHTRSKKGRVKQASPPLNPESPVPKPPNSSGKAKRKQPSALGPGGPGWCSLCQVECNTEEMLEQHVAGKRHKRHLQKLDGDQEGAKKKQYSSEIKLGDDLAGDTHLVVHEGSNLVKKGSTDDGGGEEQTAKKPRLEDSESEIGTLDLSSTMEMEQSSKLNEVCSRLDGEYVDDVEEPVEDDVDNSASLTNIQAIGGSAEFLVSNCGQQDSTEDVSSGVGKILDDPSVAALLQDVNEKPACNHTEVARCKDSLVQALSCFDIENIQGDAKVLESDDEWNEEGVSPSEKLLVDETVIPDEEVIDLTIHPADEKNVDSEGGLELLDYEDLLTDEECLHVTDGEFAYDDDKSTKQLECGTGLLDGNSRQKCSDKNGKGLCDSSPFAEVVANRETALSDDLKPSATLDGENPLHDVAVGDAQVPLEANLILDGNIAMDDRDEFLVRGNAMRITVSTFGDCHVDMRDLEGDSMYQYDSESSGDTILVGDSSMDTEQPFDDEVTLICEEISQCDSLFDEDEELDESLSQSEADFETYTDISNNLHAENPIDGLDVGCDSEIERKDEIVLLFGSPLNAGAAGNGLTAENTALVQMFAERVSDSDSSENITRDGGDAVCVKILPSGESHASLLHEISSADKAADAGSFAERLSTGDCIENPPAVGGKEGSGDESRGPAAETLLTVEDHNAVNAVAETVEGFHQTGEKLVQQGGMVDLAAIHAL